MGDGSPGSPTSDQPLETPLTTQQLQTCIDFMTHHEHKRLPEIERPLKSVDLSDLVPAWDVKFVDLDLEALYLVMHAANFLDIRPLLDLACAKVASFLKGRTTVEIRKVLGIKGDYVSRASSLRARWRHACTPPRKLHAPFPTPHTPRTRGADQGGGGGSEGGEQVVRGGPLAQAQGAQNSSDSIE